MCRPTLRVGEIPKRRLTEAAYILAQRILPAYHSSG